MTSHEVSSRLVVIYDLLFQVANIRAAGNGSCGSVNITISAAIPATLSLSYRAALHFDIHSVTCKVLGLHVMTYT